MLEVYLRDKKRTRELEAQLEGYHTAIENIKKRIEFIRTHAGKNMCIYIYTHTRTHTHTHCDIYIPQQIQASTSLKLLNY